MVRNMCREVHAHPNGHENRTKGHGIQVQMPPRQVANDANGDGADCPRGSGHGKRVLDEDGTHQGHAGQCEEGCLDWEESTFLAFNPT